MIHRSLSRIVPILAAALVLAALLPAQTRDRMLAGVRLERDTVRGTWKVTASVTIATTDGQGADLSYFVRTTHGGAGGTPAGPDVTVNVTVLTNPACTGTVVPPCTGGTCPAIASGGGMVAGSCEPYLIMVPGCTPQQICACWYRGIDTAAATEVEADAGDQLTVQIFKTPAALADSFCTPPNETITVTVGSTADQAALSGAWREPTPEGGQADDGAVAADGASTFLDQAGLVRQGGGPFEYWGAPLTPVTLTHGAPGPGLPVTLFFGPPATSFAVLPMAGFSIDLDATLAQVVLYDGLFGQAPPGVTGASGTLEIPYVLPPAGTVRLGSLQGASADPAACCGIALTSRNDIGVQVVTPAVAPDLPPLAAGGPPPEPGQSAAYPWPRDVVFPNSGPTASAAGVRDGTLHSLIGTGFDATNPSANSVLVNGVAAEIAVVRPYEILFRLLPAHATAIGGPVTVVAPGGTFNAEPDRMENWVIALPPPSLVRTEIPNVGAPFSSGGFRAAPGIQAARGSVSAVDFWDLGLGAVPPNTPVTMLLAEIDPATDQVVARCQPPTSCFDPLLHPATQSPVAPNALNDVRLGLHPGSAQPAAVILENGGPGLAAMGTVAVPGGTVLLGVRFDAAAPGSVAPFPYLLVVSW